MPGGPSQHSRRRVRVPAARPAQWGCCWRSMATAATRSAGVITDFPSWPAPPVMACPDQRPTPIVCLQTARPPDLCSGPAVHPAHCCALDRPCHARSVRQASGGTATSSIRRDYTRGWSPCRVRVTAEFGSMRIKAPLRRRAATWRGSSLWRPTGTTTLRAALRAVLGRGPVGRSTTARGCAAADVAISPMSNHA